MVKNPPANARDAGDTGLIPGAGGRSLAVGNATHSMDRGTIVTWDCKELDTTAHALPPSSFSIS